MPRRRYEILLPLRFNDGRAIPPERFNLTRHDLVAQFGAVSFQPWPVQGIWRQGGTVYEDELIAVVVDVDDSPASRAVFRRFKTVLLERFEQFEI